MINKSLKILYVYNGIFVFAGGLLGPLYALFVTELDNKVFSVSLTWAVFLISSSIFTFVISKLRDDLVKEKEYLLLAGFLTRAVVWFLYIFVDSLASLAILQFLLGLGEALGSPTFNSIFAEHLDPGRHIAEYANWQLIVYIVVALSTLLGGLIVTYFGFRPLFFLMSLLAIVSFFGVLFTPRKLL